MREIKFRAWDDAHNVMHGPYGLEDWHVLYEKDIDYGRITPLQFTGLADHTGREIYEGDILKDFMAWGDTEFREVFWGDGEWLLDREFTLSLFRCLDDGDHDYVVAGNIFEHPELLEK